MLTDTKFTTVLFNLLLVVLSFIAISANGQQQVIPNIVVLETEEETVPRYAIELIVFEHIGEAADTSEIFKPDIPEVSVSEEHFVEEIIPEEGRRITTPEKNTAHVMQDAVAVIPPYLLRQLKQIPTFEQAGFIWLETESFQLTNIFTRLRNLPTYRPILHTAWIQPVLEKENTKPLKLRRIGDPPLRLNGTLSVYLSRFLHLTLDLTLKHQNRQRLAGRQHQLSVNGDDQPRAEVEFDMQFVESPIYYRIQEDRIFSNNELRYFDHPKFGVLAQISLIEENITDETSSSDNISENFSN